MGNHLDNTFDTVSMEIKGGSPVGRKNVTGWKDSHFLKFKTTGRWTKH